MREFDWHLTDACNFNCAYCHPNIASHKNEPSTTTLTSKEIAFAFNRTGEKFHLTMSGGEPLLFPNFVDFCQEVTSKGNIISVNTNLSEKKIVHDFAAQINPENIGVINAALHILERERLDLSLQDFAENIRMLQEKGINVNVFYVLYPSLLDRFEQDAKNLESFGINNIAGKIFKGRYKGQTYPDSYSPEERKKILAYKHNSYPITIDYLKDAQRSFKGKLCYAGVTFFKVDVKGNVMRCPANTRLFGNIYDGTFQPDTLPSICTSRKALAVSQCKRFIIYDSSKKEK